MNVGLSEPVVVDQNEKPPGTWCLGRNGLTTRSSGRLNYSRAGCAGAGEPVQAGGPKIMFSRLKLLE